MDILLNFFNICFFFGFLYHFFHIFLGERIGLPYIEIGVNRKSLFFLKNQNNDKIYIESSAWATTYKRRGIKLCNFWGLLYIVM